MIPLTETIGRLAWTQVWQVTLVAVGVGLVAQCCCRRRPHLAYLLWLVVLLKCATPPLLSSPTSLFSWTATTWPATPDTAAADVQRADRDAFGAPSVEQGAAQDTLPNSDAAAMSGDAALHSETNGPTVASERAVPAGTQLSFALILGLLWLAGVLAHGGLVFWTVWRWRRMIRGSQLPVDPKLATLAEQLARRLGIVRSVRLIVTSQPMGPVTYGWLRPAIVLPQALVAAGSIADLEPLVAHELVHVRRRNALVGLVQVVVQSLWWFHPLVSWANRRMMFERERCCDEEVLATLDVPPARYAHGLLSVLELKQRLQTPAMLPGVRRMEITRQRLEHLMHGGRFQKRMPRRYWLVLAAAVLLLVPGAGLSGSGEPAVADRTSDAKPASNAAEAAPKPEQPAVPLPKLGIRLTDVRRTAGEEPGSIVWRFTVAEPVGTQFQIEYSNIGMRGASRASFGIFTTTADQVDVELMQRYRPGTIGDRRVDVLHSWEEQLPFQVTTNGTNLSGLATVASAPLWNVPPQEREITLIKRDTDAGAVTRFGGRRILLAYPKSQAGQNPEMMKMRSEITVTRYEQQPAPSLSAADRLTNAWARQPHEIGSAQIEYRLFRGNSRCLAPLGRDEVNKILEAADLDKHPEGFPAAVAKLTLPEKLEGFAAVTGMPGKVFLAGLNRRDQNAWYTNVCDGDLEMWHDPANQQIDVYVAGKSMRNATGISDFRIPVNPSLLQALEHELLPDGRIRLWKATADDRVEWIVDPDTGFVERASSDGIQPSDRFQYAPVRYPGGIVMPSLIVTTGFHEGALTSLEIWKVDKAQFNDGMPVGIFRLDAKAGTNVLLYGTDRAAQPKSVLIREETADVTAFLRGRSDLVPELRAPLPNMVR